jgi:hypothetical protein
MPLGTRFSLLGQIPRAESKKTDFLRYVESLLITFIQKEVYDVSKATKTCQNYPELYHVNSPDLNRPVEQ